MEGCTPTCADARGTSKRTEALARTSGAAGKVLAVLPCAALAGAWRWVLLAPPPATPSSETRSLRIPDSEVLTQASTQTDFADSCVSRMRSRSDQTLDPVLGFFIRTVAVAPRVAPSPSGVDATAPSRATVFVTKHIWVKITCGKMCFWSIGSRVGEQFLLRCWR